MAVDICAMQENLRWEGVEAEAHFRELATFGEFNYFISEYFQTPAPALNVLNALAALMGWSGDAKQIVTKMTGQRHSEEAECPKHYEKFLAELRSRDYSSLGKSDQERFLACVIGSIDWQKFDHERECYDQKTPMNSYDVLKCSQALFHLYEWFRGLVSEADRPSRYVEIDMKAYRMRELELKQKGCWPEEPPPGPQERTC